MNLLPLPRPKARANRGGGLKLPPQPPLPIFPPIRKKLGIFSHFTQAESHL